MAGQGPPLPSVGHKPTLPKTHLDWAAAQEVQIHVLSKEVTFRVGGVKFLTSHEEVRSKVVSCLKKGNTIVRYGAHLGPVGTCAAQKPRRRKAPSEYSQQRPCVPSMLASVLLGSPPASAHQQPQLPAGSSPCSQTQSPVYSSSVLSFCRAEPCFP
jgi:hypothetical protein